MVQLPNNLLSFQSEAQKILASGYVRHLEYSGATYQIEVIDPKSKKDCWVFMHLDPQGQIEEAFCSCEEEEEVTQCPHIAAAYLRIYKNDGMPLHEKFEISLWNRLGQIFFNRLGDKISELEKKGNGLYERHSASGKLLFFIKGLNENGRTRLKDIFEHRLKETEENSLKFSNLSQEELNLWREGRPSNQLSYELSYWNDIAHWLMELQENGEKYKITFQESLQGIPNNIKITFTDVEAEFYLSEANLPQIIPTLATVDSPLKVFQDISAEAATLLYDKQKATLNVLLPSKSKKQLEDGVNVNGWRYVQSKGFHLVDPEFLKQSTSLSGKEIAHILNEYGSLIKYKLKGAELHPQAVTLSYSLSFDPQWNLHIVGYAFEPGDLTTAHAQYFDEWIYLEDDGFYHIEEQHFDFVEKIIPCEQVADFIWRERSWLNEQPGFQTHLSNVEASLSYALDENQRLKFFRIVPLKDTAEESKDFGPWIYLAGKGFFSKVSVKTNLPVQSDISIGPEQIPLFIKMNRSELQMVPGFFAIRSPVKRSALEIILEEDRNIKIVPKFFLNEEYQDKKVLFFGDFVYVAEEGFFELTAELRLPEEFRHVTYIEKEHLPSFLDRELAALAPRADFIDPRLLPPRKLDLIASKLNLSDQKDYFTKLYFETERGRIPITQIWWALKQKQDFLFSENGLLDLSDSRFDWIKLLGKKQVDRKSEAIHLSTIELLRLNAFEEIGSTEDSTKKPLQDLLNFKVLSEPDLSGMTSHLRPYQEQGVHWLWFLYQHRLSGLLCDDMGLGKTHQAMALIAAVMNEYKRQGKQEQMRHFLIVCPTSVMYHWQEKLQQFFPHLRVCTFYGSERSLDDFHEQYDLLLTSYGIWRLESKLLTKVPFEVAVFDEVQVAKNQNSLTHSSLKNVNAQMRLGLTGTPIENKLRELKSLFDIVLPGYMPGEKDYRDLFVKPIEREGDQEQQLLLKRLIRPFVLRRKKATVLLDLPEKTEEIAHCDLSEDQKMFYSQALFQSRRQLMEQLQDTSNPIPFLHIFALLSHLKQICDHPAVYLKKPEDYRDFESGKWELFKELLHEARESEQKVVIFSQYLAMLDIFAIYLNEMGVGFSSIRGSTVDRGDQVHRFNHDPKCEVFLGSLQAAGLGIDLTAASVVIHYDRWWNAARENQATDRVHRIGQTRGVQVFKLVTKGTFEERIDELIRKKGQLMEQVVTAEDQNVIKQFTREELMELLKELEQ